MADVIFGDGIEVVIDGPSLPSFTSEPPGPRDVVVVPEAGPRGQQGPAGVRYTFVQETPAATWTIHHDLGAYPNFLFFLDEDPLSPVFTDVTYPNGNTAVVEWPEPYSGRAES